MYNNSKCFSTTFEIVPSYLHTYVCDRVFAGNFTWKLIVIILFYSTEPLVFGEKQTDQRPDSLQQMEKKSIKNFKPNF
jgi:hypothetical protein